MQHRGCELRRTPLPRRCVNSRLANAPMVVNSPRSSGRPAWPNAAPVYPPLELFGPVGGLLGRVLGFAHLPLTGAQGPLYLSVDLMRSFLPRPLLLFVYAHALSPVKIAYHFGGEAKPSHRSPR